MILLTLSCQEDSNVSAVQIAEEATSFGTNNSPSFFVAVHIGAGFHSFAKTGFYRSLCESICKEVSDLLKSGCKAREAVTKAMVLLENSPLTNAGIGSNLTLEEKVECDAAIMDKHGFGAVGALSNIKNPIMVPLTLLEAQSKGTGTLSFGRIVPCLLVGEGAKLWARDHNIEEVSDDYLKTGSIIKTHRDYKAKMDLAGLKKNHSVPESPKNPTCVSLTNLNGLNETRRLDTVGAIVLDSDGEIASAVSSGGILLKHPGRVGHASMFGCGCWVDEYQEQDEDAANENTNANIAAVTTGCGEYIIKTLFAKAICEHMVKNQSATDYRLNDFFETDFFGSRLLKKCSDKYVGAMVCKQESHRVELLVAHTTPSMCFGYKSSQMKEPTSIMSRLEGNKKLVISNFHLNLNKEPTNDATISEDERANNYEEENAIKRKKLHR